MNSYILFKDQRLNSGMMIADNLFLKENKAGSFLLLKKKKEYISSDLTTPTYKI